MEARKNHALNGLSPVCFSIYTLPVIPLADKGYESRSLPASKPRRRNTPCAPGQQEAAVLGTGFLTRSSGYRQSR